MNSKVNQSRDATHWCITVIAQCSLAHIFFDDAFEINEFGEPVINSFVKQLLEVVDVAAG